MNNLKILLTITQVMLLLTGAIYMSVNIYGDTDLFNRGLLYLLISNQAGIMTMLIEKESP